ncbi:MAG: D-glycero-beta-D-manno-heptose 1,7-bisphosphate 7-phosphatase [Gammaproteobacteria bacterium]
MKLIILDRDGVINEDSDDFIKSTEEFIPIAGSLEAIARLNQSGYSVAIATNQSGIARGLYSLDTLNSMHEKLHRLLAPFGGHIDAIFFCPHGPDAHCECRKPKIGMFNEIKQRFGIELYDVFAVGDSLRDVQAAQAAGANPVLVRTGKGERTLANGEGIEAVPVFANLAAFVDELLMHEI